MAVTVIVALVMALTVVALVGAFVEVVLVASLVGVAWVLLVGTMVVGVLGR